TPTMMSMMVLSPGVGMKATGSPPRAVMMAFTRPIWTCPGGSYSYIKPQITPAPTKEIAMGMKIMALARDSYFTRSARTANNRPKPTVPETISRIHLIMLPYDERQKEVQNEPGELKFSSLVS